MIASDGTDPWPDPRQEFAGAVDEVALYDTALTAQEIETYFGQIIKSYGAEPPAAADAAPGEVIRVPKEPEAGEAGSRLRRDRSHVPDELIRSVPCSLLSQ